MCTVCGLPTTHSNLIQTLGLLTLLSFGFSTFVGAWWILTVFKAKGWLSSFWSWFLGLSMKD